MGKTPARGTDGAMAATIMSSNNGHTGGGKLRYRRKVLTSDKGSATAAGEEDNQREAVAATGGKRHDAVEDNQRDHEELVAVAPMGHGGVSSGNQGRDTKKPKKKHKPWVTRGDQAQSPEKELTSKKAVSRKFKRGVHGEKNGVHGVQPAHDKDTVEAHREPEVATGAGGVSVDIGSKDAADRVVDGGVLAPTAHDGDGLSVDTPTRAQHHKESNFEKHKRVQLSRKEDKSSKRRPKQLQWKVKVKQPAAEVDGLASVTSRLEVAKDLKKDVADEEVDFAARERQSLKLRAKSLSYPIESSSQETQSGSDDDSATFIQFSHPLAPLPSVLPHVEDASEHLPEAPTEGRCRLDEVCFPMPLPLEQVAALATARVHEVIISDFAFHPSEIQVDAGDAVVWRVNEQTPRMIEHCLDVKLMRTSDASSITASTSTLSAGDKFAWRFGDAGAATISCSVYGVRGSITVNAVQAPTPDSVERNLSKRKRAKTKKQKKSKQRDGASSTTKDPALLLHVTDASAELSRDELEPVEIFHSSPDLLKHGGDPDMDVGLCEAVLSQLDAVANSVIVGVNASSRNVFPMIVVGDVACPIYEDLDQAADDGAEDTANDHVEQNNAVDEVSDFQERVIAMLKRSEEMQAEHRRSFAVDGSGFDALCAYDFLKRRFTNAQSSCERVVYL